MQQQTAIFFFYVYDAEPVFFNEWQTAGCCPATGAPASYAAFSRIGGKKVGHPN